MVGRTISHYKILEKIGEGGMGVVYKAEDLKLTRTVALKFLPHALAAQEPERARFLQEARAAAILNHPNICTVYDILDQDGEQFIVLEYVEGVTVRKKIENGGLKIEDCIKYAIQIAEALQEAHTHGIVHRDIKAENIMVNSKNQVKVMDFGLAKLKGSLKLTKSSSTVGTLAYMAPEQIQGGEVDARSDIFSFGVVLYEMLTGHLPFRGEHEAAMVYSIVNEEPTPVQQYLPNISSEIVHILERALDKDPEDRYQSVHEMLIDLRRSKKESTRVVRTPPSQGPAPLTPERATQASTPSPPRLNKKIWYIAGLALAAVTLAILWRVFFSGERHAKDTYPFQTFTPARIATNAKPRQAALSPDGRYIIYAADEAGKQSVWMRQVSAASSVRILPPENVWYGGFTFSPDGDRVYYSAVTGNDTRGALFVVPTLGGTPRKLTSNIAGGVAVSPDEKQLAFIRPNPSEGEEALMVCAADGSNERKLVGRKGEDFFVSGFPQAPGWSPDGTTIATSVGSVTGKIYMSVLLVSVADGSSRLATSNRWATVGSVVWVNDGRGIVLTGTEYLTGVSPQLWYIDLATGNVRRLTTDLNSYDGTSLSITTNQSKLLVLQQNFTNAIDVLPGGDWHKARQITSRGAYGEGYHGLDWTPDGRLVFASLMSGNSDIWIMDADGKNRRQLTTNPYAQSTPSVSWDGQFIAYASAQDTTSHIWRMDLDGSNQERLTTGVLDDYSPCCGPDGRWIYFHSFRNKGRCNLWRVPVTGGDPAKVSDDDLTIAESGISPDGRSILVWFVQTTNNRLRWAALSTENGAHAKEFDLPTTANWGIVSWAPGGKGVAYIDTRNGVSNIWVLPLGTMKAYQLTHFDSEVITGFAWSKDGRDLALVRGEGTSDVVLLTEVK
jgi:serine/threonine protein kinase/Tol biopolymer transport system component